MKNVPVNEYVEALDKLHKEIQKHAEAENYNMASELLEKCQDYAIMLGTMIEKRAGEGTAAVGCLEDYCEMVYQMHGNFQQKEESADQISVKLEPAKLDAWLSNFSNCVENDLDIHIEAVFLPFRADTWGALESVWQAAKEDPKCDAYVIPIPYYDKRPDGTFGEMHYEADQFPVDVPITFYENYDFAGRRPDMVFIQNPYDECNYTSSVHPFYYAKNLKQFTNKLIYIPWFTIEEIGENDERGAQSTQYFVKVPGVMYADKVIVQSERMRQFYIDALTEAEGEHTRSVWEEKILGLGSPLYDQKEDVRKIDWEIPEEWKKLIYKPDGSRKKVIIYGTSVSKFLQYKEQVLKKMHSVFEIFHENTDEVVLLWRPDARLTAEMSVVAGKELMQSYLIFAEQYKKEGWGIYDESTDLEKLVLLADAYYGDSCRLVLMCRQAGLPVMLQDIDLCETDKGGNIC